MTQEEWRDIPTYEMYQASSLGNIMRKSDGLILKQYIQKSGYAYVCLNRKYGNRYVPVHRLVACAFLGMEGYEHGLYVDHINTIRSDNRACNLRWVTPLENANNETTKINRKKKKNKIMTKEEAIQRIKDWNLEDDDMEVLAVVIPELKESEDERIRKELIEFVKSRGGFKQEYIAWLEKQGEQKTINDEWIEDYWKRHKVSNPHSYDKGDEIQFDYNGFKRFCKQFFQKPAWSEEDGIAFDDVMWAIEQARTIAKDENDMGNLWYAERWLKSLKDRITLTE